MIIKLKITLFNLIHNLLEAELLKRSSKYAESVYALVIYYYSLKFNNLIELIDNQEMRLQTAIRDH